MTPARRSCPHCQPQPNDFLQYQKTSSLNIAIGGSERSTKELVYKCSNCGRETRVPADERV
jgi:RNase P subunit RPR2